MTGYAPETVRKAAALVEKLDKVLDEFGARLPDTATPFAFTLIGHAGVYLAIPENDPDKNTPTELAIGLA